MMERKYRLWLLGLLSLLMLNCNRKENYLNYTDANLPAPAQVQDARVIPRSGGAYIVYKIPKDPNLRYVKAVYETAPGSKWEVKSSYYTDTLKIEGFGDTEEYDVKLYSVGKNEKASDPLVVKIKPLTPAIQSVYETLSIGGTFGGINVKLQNPERANLAVVILQDTLRNGNYSELTTYYTAADRVNFSVRGMDTTERKFAVLLRDRWNNKTAQKNAIIKPWFEKQIDKGSWKAMELPGDNYEYVENYPLRKIFDGGFGYCCLFATRGYQLPQTFTLDLGRPVAISRMRTWLHPEGAYQGSHPKNFEIWGANSVNPDGDYVDLENKIYRSNWVKLGTFSSFKPSGEGPVTTEDKDYALNRGEEFEFEAGIPTVRYIRFKTLNTWGISSGQTQIVIQELTLWGQDGQ
ncbi:DUF4959 domain-containing protein [Niabella sp.]|uniref:DUF4959 domain-containing protein n=1 Tax=Niabella sp. TaxID=1962976 RepID=UPI00260AC2AF|nr:DUF4959 domain-containing protein [Niabella sp.]